MDSRTRVIKTLNHETVDRIPFDCTFIVTGYNRLVDYLGLPDKKMDTSDPFLYLNLDLEIAEIIKNDCFYVTLSQPYGIKKFSSQMTEYTDEWGLVYSKIYGDDVNFDFAVIKSPLAKLSYDDLENYPWPDPDNPGRYKGLSQRSENLYKNTDLALIGRFGASIFTHASLLRGMEQWLIDLYSNRSFVKKVLDKITDYYIRVYKNALKRAGKYIQVLRMDNDDYGMQTGPLISVKMFREIIKPHIHRFYKVIKDEYKKYNPNGKIMKHSCGDISEYLDDFIDMGIDLINPVQPVGNMVHKDLKAKYGDKISFHGGIDIQNTLLKGTPTDVQEAVKIAINTLGSDKTGYILAPTHHIPGDIPPKNVIAMRDTLIEMS
jgi:uroporphyrinogen decarboxylase